MIYQHITILHSKLHSACCTHCVCSHLHDTIPVVAGRYPEEREEGYAEVLEVCVFTETLAGMQVVALWNTKKSVLNLFTKN